MTTKIDDSRRHILQSLAALGLVSALPSFSSHAHSRTFGQSKNNNQRKETFDEEFVIVDNWVLLATDLKT